MSALEKFIVKAKSNGWVGSEKGGLKVPPSRLDSFDIVYDQGDFHYRDSFVGFHDFCGQEHVTFKNEAVWSMAYYCYILKPEIFTPQEAVNVLQASLTEMYKEKRFLGGYIYKNDTYEYRDMNLGDFARFNGIEKIYKNSECVYELLYFGGKVFK